MSICIGNVEKFFNDHPEFESSREETLKRAKALAGGGNIISGADIWEVFGFLTPHFEREMFSPEHVDIGIKALQQG